MIPPSSFTPLRENLGQQVYQHLRDRIYRMEIAPGSRLGVGEIAEQLGVSRSPVRDAIMMLVNEGIVEVNSTGGYRVIQLTRPYIEDAFVVRSALEKAAMRLCMAHLDRPRIKALRAKWEELAREGHSKPGFPASQILADQEFHHTIAGMSNNPLLIDAIERVNSVTWLISRFTNTSAQQVRYAPITAQEHLRVLDAMLSGDAEAAVAALDEHLNRAFVRSLERLDTAQNN